MALISSSNRPGRFSRWLSAWPAILALACCIAACIFTASKNEHGSIAGVRAGLTTVEPDAGYHELNRSVYVGCYGERMVLAIHTINSEYPLPAERTPVPSSAVGFFEQSDDATIGDFGPRADPSTFPTRSGFALADVHFPMSSHTTATYQAMIFPSWLLVALSALLTAVLVGRHFYLSELVTSPLTRGFLVEKCHGLEARAT